MLNGKMFLQKKVSGGSFNYMYKSKGTENLSDLTITFSELDSYVQAPITAEQMCNANSWEIGGKFKFTNAATRYQTLFSFDFSPHDYSFDSHLFGVTYSEHNTFTLYVGTGYSWNICEMHGTSTYPAANQEFYVKYAFTGTQYQAYYRYATDTNWTTIGTKTSSTKMNTSMSKQDLYFTVGENSFRQNGGYQFYGTVFMADTYLKINGAEVWRGA